MGYELHLSKEPGCFSSASEIVAYHQKALPNEVFVVIRREKAIVTKP